MTVMPFVQAILTAKDDELYAGILAKKIGWEQRRWNYVQSVFYAGFEVTRLKTLQKSMHDFYDLDPKADIRKRISNPDTLPSAEALNAKPVLPKPKSPTHSQQIVKLLGQIDEDDVKSGKVDLLELRNQIEPQVESEKVMSAMLAHLRSWAKVSNNVALIYKVKQGFFNGRDID